MEKKQAIVRYLVEEKFSETIAKAAVQAVAVDKLNNDECYVWALSNDFGGEMDDEVLTLLKKYEEEEGKQWMTVVLLKSLFYDVTQMLLFFTVMLTYGKRAVH